MRIAELQPGGIYLFKRSAGRYGDWCVGMLLDVEPWSDVGARPAPIAELDEWSRSRYRRRVRDVPVMEFVPQVTLADGSQHRLPFGPSLHVHVSGYGNGRVKPAQLHVECEPVLVSIAHITRRVG